MRILVVDDQRVSRKKLEKIVAGLGDCILADCGRVALEAYQKSLQQNKPFDLVTLDISMPDLDGHDVLAGMRTLEQRHPDPARKPAIILMVTASSDKQTVLACAEAGCNGYIVKPLNREIIEKKLLNFGFEVGTGEVAEKSVAEMVALTVRLFRQDKLELPSLPQVVQKIQDLMALDKTTAAELAAAIEEDAAIAVKLITTANSPVYRGAQATQNVSMALNRLGMEKCQNIVSAIANKGLYQTKNAQCREMMHKLWQHALACAHGAKALAEQLGLKPGERLFTIGLIHDIGCVLLLKSLGDIAAEEETFANDELLDGMHEVHANLGAELLARWQFSDADVNIVKLHEWEVFGANSDKNLLVINLADHLAHHAGYGFFNRPDFVPAELDAAKRLALKPDVIEDIEITIRETMEKAAETF